MDKDNQEILETFFNTAQLLLANEGEVKPLYVLLKDRTVMPVIQMGMDFRTYANTVIETAHNQDMDAAILICEQYMVKGHKDDPAMEEYNDGSKSIREHPNCKPYLMGCFMTAEGKYDSMIAEIHTEPSKGTKFVYEPEWMKDVETNYLVPWRTKS